jgi:hypothetical protein
MPNLMKALGPHGYLALDPTVRQRLLAASAGQVDINEAQAIVQRPSQCSCVLAKLLYVSAEGTTEASLAS